MPLLLRSGRFLRDIGLVGLFKKKTPQEMNACLRLRKMAYSNIKIDLQT